MLADIINDPLTYFLSAITCAIGDLNLRSTNISLQRSINSFTNESALCAEIKILKEHSYGEYLCQRIGDV